VENERFLVRAAEHRHHRRGRPHGRVLERTELFERAVLVRDVPLLAGSTFYTRTATCSRGPVWGPPWP
jgi:apolipoprotein N-acyltransferase